MPMRGFKLFEQTLRELHQQESAPVVHAKRDWVPGLADIWRRLDGPTDTD